MYTVFIVDDEYEIRKGLSTFFPWEMLGFKVIGQAENGQKALDFFLRGTVKVDVLLTDVKMPVMNGIELAKKLKELGTDVTVIFLSAYSDFEYARDALKLKVYDYILKPTEYENLIDVFTKLKIYLDEANFPGQNMQQVEEHPGDSLNYQDKIIKALKAYLMLHYSDATLELAARFANYSPSYLSLIFKEQTGMNFSDYLIEIKMKKAVELLGNINYKINEISEMVGYSNPKNFTRTFKKYFGASPREYRK